MLSLDLDVIGVAETHLQNNDILSLTGYTWMGNNRTNTHRKAPKGSGGVGVFIRNELYEQFNIENIDCETEGMFWFSLTDKSTTEKLLFCVCYVPPANSTRQINVGEYFDTLMTKIHQYQNKGLVTLCGDFNIRIGNHDDFIPGVDDVIVRNVVDFKTNQYYDTFLDFLISTNFCVLNGKKYKHNDFTSVSTRGCAVVDYCLIPYEQLYRYTNFDVKRSTTMVTDVIGVETMNRISVPDHSVLLWMVKLEYIHEFNTHENYETIHKKVNDEKYNRNITELFMCD